MEKLADDLVDLGFGLAEGGRVGGLGEGGGLPGQGTEPGFFVGGGGRAKSSSAG